MDANLQLRIQRYGWDKACDRYETGWRQSLEPVQQRLIDVADARPGERVLDLACGTGLVSLPLARSVGPTGQVVATDLSHRMVERVAEQAQDHGMGWLKAERADAGHQPTVADGSIDLVTCALGLMYVPDPSAVFREALRVLRPGGRAVFSVWGLRSNCGWAEIFPIVDQRVRSEVCPLFFRLGGIGSLAREMEQAGFVDTNDERLDTRLPYASAGDALDAAFAGGPVALAYNRFDEATREEAHADYLASIEPYRTDDGYRIPGEFVVASGRKASAS